MEIVIGLFLTIVLIIPTWKIFAKTGHSPALSLLLFIPFFGLFIVLCILAFSDWRVGGTH